MTDLPRGWVLTAPEPWKWGEEWIVRAHRQSATPIKRRTVAVSFVAHGVTREQAEAKALPKLLEAISEQEARDAA